MESSDPHLSTDQNKGQSNERSKEKRKVPKEVHQNLVSAVELNQLEEVQRCLSLGANPEQRFLQTFSQHYLTERAILNQNEPMAKLLLEGRSPEQEETLRIVRAAVRVNNYAWIEQYGEALSETNPTILEMTLEFACMGIFNRIVKSFLHEPIQPLVQGWYQLAIKYRQPE